MSAHSREKVRPSVVVAVAAAVVVVLLLLNGAFGD